jgi:hypothetical protein
MLVQQLGQRPKLTSMDRLHQGLGNRITSRQPPPRAAGALCSSVLRHDRHLLLTGQITLWASVSLPLGSQPVALTVAGGY